MNEHSDPISFLIDFAWANGADKFTVNNAKDEVKKLRQRIADLNQELVNLDLEYDIVGWARINDRGDIYDPRLIHNPHIEESTLIPLYIHETEYKNKREKLSKQTI